MSIQPSKRRAWAMGVALAIGTAWAVAGPFRAHANWMYFEQDDFFYYLNIAQNLAYGHGSTFNGLVPTNGYHPLWMLLLAALFKLGAGTHGIFLFLSISIWVATLACYVFCLLLFQRGMQPAAACVFAAFVAVYCMHLFTEGMEVNLAVPLMFALLAAVSRVEWWGSLEPGSWLPGFLFGLLTSAMILARLNTAMFAVLLAGAALLPFFWRRLRPVERAMAFASLVFPVAYFTSLSWLSEWRLWGWYFYSLRPALALASLWFP